MQAQITPFYTNIDQQLQSLLSANYPFITNLANFSALIYEHLPEINWAGFYLLQGDSLFLGPFQGKVACVEIPLGRGVCGTAAKEQRILRVEDVEQFSGHIACDSASRSEIVIPIYQKHKLLAVLDIDSPVVDRFRVEDEEGLQQLVHTLQDNLEQ